MLSFVESNGGSSLSSVLTVERGLTTTTTFSNPRRSHISADDLVVDDSVARHRVASGRLSGLGTHMMSACGRLHSTAWQPAAGVALAVVACVALPFLATQYQVYVANTILVACIGVLGLNLLTGLTGQISIGHGAFVGVGAFTSALLVTRAGAPLWLSIPAAGALTTVIGCLFGLPSVRIKGLYLAVATLAAQMIVEWTLSRPMIAGSGSVPAPRPDVLQDDHAYYVVLLVVTVAATLFARNLTRTRVGRAMLAVRDREVAAAVIGIDASRVKLMAFGLSAFYAGIAGALLAHLSRSVNFEQFRLELSIQYLAMIVIGGLGSVRGSVLGAVFVTLLPIALRSALAPVQSVIPTSATQLLSSAQVLLFGLVIVASMLLQPSGLARLLSNATRRLELHLPSRPAEVA
jgi:branched-chain amino acid transport system permease protein